MIRGNNRRSKRGQRYTNQGRQTKYLRRLPENYSSSRRNILLGGLLFLSTAAVAALVFRPLKRSSPNGKTLHIMLSDATDPPIDVRQLEMAKYIVINSVINNSKKDDMVVIEQLTSNPNSPIKEVFSVQDTGSENDNSIWTHTPKLVKKIRNSEFISPFREALNISMLQQKQKRTPFIEAVKFIANNPIYSEYSNVKLMIVSDGLQNTEVSAYKGTLYGMKGMNFLQNNKVDLNRFDVSFIRLRRPNYEHIQDEKHQAWIESYFYDNEVASFVWSEV